MLDPHTRFRTRRLKPSVAGVNLVMKCNWITCHSRYELGGLRMGSKTVLLMLKRFAQQSG